jgi:hypothetical protein
MRFRESPAVKFRQYENRQQRMQAPSDPQTGARLGGRERTGQILAPAPGGVWILPVRREESDPPVALLGHGNAARGYWVAESEQTRAPSEFSSMSDD